MKRRIFLHGYLKGLCPDGLELNTVTVAEAIGALKLPIDPLEGRHRVRVLGFDTKEALYSPSDVEEIHLVPDFSGGKGGLLQIIIGTVLVVASIITFNEELIPGIASMMGFTEATISAVALGVGMMGASLMLGGLLQMLSPAPKMDATQDSGSSLFLGAAQNTTAIGTRIPILYGRTQVFGQILSCQNSAVDVTTSSAVTFNNFTTTSTGVWDGQSWNTTAGTLTGAGAGGLGSNTLTPLTALTATKSSPIYILTPTPAPGADDTYEVQVTNDSVNYVNITQFSVQVAEGTIGFASTTSYSSVRVRRTTDGYNPSSWYQATISGS